MSVNSIRRYLRPRKPVDYKAILDNTLTSENGDVSFKADSESESSGSELFSKKSKSKEKRSPSPLMFNQQPDPDDELNEYRLQRQKNMQDRFKVLQTLEFEDDVENLKTIPLTPKSTPKSAQKRRIPMKTSSREPLKRSLRLQNRILNTTLDISADTSLTDSFQEDKINPTFEDERILNENLRFVDDGAEGDLNVAFMQGLKDDLSIPYDSSDFSNYDIDELSEIVRKCRMNIEPLKIIKQRVVSLDFHPSQKKFIILAGDKLGNVALRDIITNEGVEKKCHAFNTNCVSFSQQDSCKFFSTSLDGTVRQGDVNDANMQMVYASSDRDHTTWHHEFGHSLLIAHGKGIVKLLDLRASESNHVVFRCHNRSVRTVQMHPANENYFLTSSGSGAFGIWDIRKPNSEDEDPVVYQKFDKGLTSAFFSAKGNYVLATCNDDTIRSFDCSRLQISVQHTSIQHNNHGGRWLSVFKARWIPHREDAFIVGSMMNNPKRIQIYDNDGKMIHQLMNKDMVTYNPVVIAHPTKPIFVGGNGSGRVHIFSPYSSLSDLCS